MSRTAEPGAARTRIQSAARAVRALLLVAEDGDGLGASEVARRLGLAVPTTFHLLNTLVDEGLLTKHERGYYLGPKAGLIADAFMHQQRVPPFLMTPLSRLAEETRETAYLSRWRHGEVVVLASIEGSRHVRVGGPHLGFVGCAHARASGKALLAALDAEALDAYLATHPLERLTPNTITTERALRSELGKVADRGYATDDEEFREGAACLAVPILGQRALLGAYTVAVPVDRLPAKRDQYLKALRAAATEGAHGHADQHADSEEEDGA